MVQKIDMRQVLIGCLNASIRRQELKEVREVVGLSSDFQVATVALNNGKTIEMEAQDLLPIDPETGMKVVELHG